VSCKAVGAQSVDRVSALQSLLGAHGVAGELKNLIFAADGPKPRIVLRDAVNNVIDIVENAQYCLVYDPLAEHGLTWRDLVKWWTEQHPGPGTQRDHARDLYNRLAKSLGDNPVGKRSSGTCLPCTTSPSLLPEFGPDAPFGHHAPACAGSWAPASRPGDASLIIATSGRERAAPDSARPRQLVDGAVSALLIRWLAHAEPLRQER
jgi:hypothetical protein